MSLFDTDMYYIRDLFRFLNALQIVEYNPGEKLNYKRSVKRPLMRNAFIFCLLIILVL